MNKVWLVFFCYEKFRIGSEYNILKNHAGIPKSEAHNSSIQIFLVKTYVSAQDWLQAIIWHPLILHWVEQYFSKRNYWLP